MALENILSQEIVQKLGWTLLHFVWQAAAVALLVGILLALLRKSSANLRYIIACTALGLIVLLPIITMQLVPVSAPQPIVNIVPAPAPAILPAQEIREIPAAEMSIPEGPVQHENAGTTFNASWKQRASDLLEPALPYIVSGWLLGVFGLSLWHLGGWAQLQRLRKKMVKQVNASLLTKLRRLSQRLGVKRAVQLAESALVQVPTVIGWLRPVILLPASALTGLSSEQLEALLAHELAHIRRYDYLVNMLQTVVETLGFYHPAVWWISHKIRAERENCCDDLAVSISGDRIRYARALTSMEEIRGRRGELAVAASGGNLFGRIHRLLGKEASDTSRASWIPSVITILLIAIIAIPTTLALTIKSESQESQQATEEIDPNSWQEKFYSLYRLEDGQVLKRIAPPFIPERRGFFLSVQSGRYSSNTYEELVSQRFNWDGDLSIRGARVGSGIYIPRLKSTLESVIGLGNREYDIPPDILSADMSGDWIVRKNTPQEELLQALEQIVKDETSRDIHFVKQKVETEVIIAKGKYNFQLLPNITDGQYVLICTNNTNTYTGGGGGSGTLDKFLRWVGNRVGMNIIDETEAEGVELSWRNHDSSELSRMNHDAKPYNQRLDLLLKNLSQQTGLKFERKTAKVEKWFISENGTIKVTQKAGITASDVESGARANIFDPSEPVVAKSDTPSGVDKPIVKVDLSVIEVPPDSKMDRETTVEIKNLLGGKITLSDSPAIADLLRKAAGATAAVKDESAGNKRVTQDQFKTLVDLLESRSYVKILMNPTLEVIDGETAKISSKQKIPGIQAPLEDSIQITPNVLEDGNIILQVEATLYQRSISQSNEQIPMINKLEISTQIRLSPGESGIISGMKQAGLLTEPDKAAKELEVPASEILVILTPTIVDTALEAQNEIDEPTDIQQEQGITISGLCRDSGGRPLSMAQVLFFCRDHRLGSMIQVAQSKTDSEGRFTLGPITPLSEEDWGRTRYFIFVPADGHGPVWKTVDLDKPNKEPLELTAYNSAVVSGSIITEDSEPVAGARVWVRGIISPEATEDPASRANDLYTIAALPGWSATTKQDGSFRIAGVPDGARIQLFISHRDFAECFVHVKPGADTKIKVQPAASIAGRVLYGKSGKPAAGVIVRAQGVESVPIPGGYIVPGAQTTTDKQGRYRLESLFGTKYNIWAEAENLTVVALDSFQARIGETREAPDFVLIEGGFIIGRIIDEATGKPIKPGQYSDVGIYGPSRPKSGAAIESSRIREDGSFRIRVAPGRNYIYLRPMDDWDRGKAIVIPPSRWINVGDGQTVEVEFKVRKLSQEEMDKEATRGQRFTMPLPKTIDELEQSERQQESNSNSAQIMIDTKILTVSDEFLKYVGLDPNSTARSENWSDYLIHASEDSVSFVIDQLHEDLLLGTVAARIRVDKDIRMFHPLPVLAKSGKKCEIQIIDSEHYRLTSPPESKSNRIELGTTIRLKPTLIQKGQNVELDFEWEYRRLQGFKEHTGPDGKVQKVPQIDVDSIRTPCTIPDGKTLLITGKKITEQKKKESGKPQLGDLPLIGGLFSSPPQVEETKNLLIMITPSTDIKAPPIPQDIKAPPKPQPIDPNDPLIKKLEEKFKRYDEKK